MSDTLLKIDSMKTHCFFFAWCFWKVTPKKAAFLGVHENEALGVMMLFQDLQQPCWFLLLTLTVEDTLEMDTAMAENYDLKKKMDGL